MPLFITLGRYSYGAATAQHAAAASQPAGIGLLPAVAPTNLRSPQQNSRPICTHFGKSVIIFVTTTPIDIKLSTCPAHSWYASAISPSYATCNRKTALCTKVHRAVMKQHKTQ